MPSEEWEQEITRIADDAEEKIKFLDTLHEPNTHWQIFLMYVSSEALVKHSENLVKHSEALVKQSKWLTRWTIGLILLGAGMIVLTMLQVFGTRPGNWWFLV